MLLEPSSPFTRPSDYDKAVEIMMGQDANLVLGMREMEISSAFVAPMENDGRITQLIDKALQYKPSSRQEIQKDYTANGALYLFKWDFFKQGKTLYRDREKSYGLLMDRLYSIEIDEMIDLQWAEFLANNHYIDLTIWQ
jgi:CMP-N-acetylneuraminic acid synthetase